MIQKTVAIIHYNTPELTEAAILSLRKHGGRGYRVVVFDNSDKRPFTATDPTVEIIDNTRGQVVNFDAELDCYPDKDRSIGCAKGCEFGSVKHMMTVQKLWELLPEGFVLMESDVLIKQSIDVFFDEQYSVVGYCQRAQPYNPFGIGRMLPMLCWVNVSLLKKEGARYFDPTRSYGLQPGGRKNRNNWYDTGAVLLEDIMKARPRLKGLHLDIRLFLEHYGSASWANNDPNNQQRWLVQHRNLWQLPTPTVALMAMGRHENQYAVEWVEHHLSLGFDKIFIFDNNREGEERISDVLSRYADKVEVIPYPEPYAMIKAYQQAYDECSYGWLMAMDFDEFLTLPEGEDIHSFVSRYAYTADVIKVNWMTYGDNGLITNDGRPLQQRFTTPLRGEDGRTESWGENQHVKSIARCGIGLKYYDPHCPHGGAAYLSANGERSEASPFFKAVNHDGAYIKHFTTKSLEEWMENKVKRGQCDCPANTEGLQQHAIELYFTRNERTAEKEAWLIENGYMEGNILEQREESHVEHELSRAVTKSTGSSTASKPETKKRRVSKKQK